MAIHLEQEHSLPPDDIKKCSGFFEESNDGPIVGEVLKSKMSSALGDLLDRAVMNLLTAKQKSNNRLEGPTDLFSKLQAQKDGLTDEDIKVAAPCKPFSCTICGQKFSLPSSRDKHQVLAHRSFILSNTPADPYLIERYDNDWRGSHSGSEVNGNNGIETTMSPLCNGCCPTHVPSSGNSHSLPDSDVDDSTRSGKRRRSKRNSRLGAQQARLVKERAKAALRELNLPRQKSSDGRGNSKQVTENYRFSNE